MSKRKREAKKRKKVEEFSYGRNATRRRKYATLAGTIVRGSKQDKRNEKLINLENTPQENTFSYVTNKHDQVTVQSDGGPIRTVTYFPCGNLYETILENGEKFTTGELENVVLKAHTNEKLLPDLKKAKKLIQEAPAYLK